MCAVLRCVMECVVYYNMLGCICQSISGFSPHFRMKMNIPAKIQQ